MSFFNPKHTSRVLSKRSIENIIGVEDNADLLELEAGEDLLAGDPVCVITNKFYKADNVTNFRVIGVITEDVLSTFSGRAITSGKLLFSGLTPGTIYYLGNEILDSTVPTSGMVVRIGQALTSSIFLVNIEEPILLS